MNGALEDGERWMQGFGKEKPLPPSYYLGTVLLSACHIACNNPTIYLLARPTSEKRHLAAKQPKCTRQRPKPHTRTSQHGGHPSTLHRLPLRLPPRRPRIPPPRSSTHHETDTSLPAPPDNHLTCYPPAHPEPIRRTLGWPITRRAQEEDVAHEEASSADGRQGVEGRHGVEQMQCVRTVEEGTRAMSLLRAE